ncbi:MAG: efflux RND transporter periplasmic adaptor subunit [Acidobacteriota bacterium]|nr:efflux RND transporter periplasmic adaptor subunit [Acidobacteriota bacterium]
MSHLITRILRVVLPVLILGLASLGAYTMYLNRPPVETQPPVIAPPSVRVQPVSFETIKLTVASQGTVQPRTSSQLVPEISGTIIEVSPSFAVGGFFEAGDMLLQIDPYDYQQAVIAGRSQLAQAELRLSQEQAEAEVARREWEEVGRGAPSALTLREPQVADAEAAVAAAQSALDRAIRDLERAEVLAPYAGRVQSKEVDIGQFVNKGNAVGRVYAVDSAEIRLPLPDEELAYVDVPMSYRGTQQQTGPSVTLAADFAGRRHSWTGRIVRTESEIDAVSRMVHVVAEVNDPYAPGADPNRPPLAAGMFVEAEIEGRTVEDIVVLPWAALRGRDQVLLVDGDDRLRFRQVEVLRSTRDQVIVQAGLFEGERVCVSALDTVTDGMVVRVIEEVDLAEQDLASPTTVATPSNDLTAPADAIAPPPVRRSNLTRGEEMSDLSPIPLDGAQPSQPDTRGPQERVFEETETPENTRQASDFELDPALSRSAQIAAIRREITRLRSISQEARDIPSTRPIARQRADINPLPTPAPTESANPNGRTGLSDGNEEQAVTSSSKPNKERSTGNRSAAANAPPPIDLPPTQPTPEPIPDRPAPKPAPTSVRNARPTSTSEPSSVASDLLVAILPFKNLSRNPADDIIGPEITSELKAALDDKIGIGSSTLPLTEDAETLAVAAAQQIRWIVNGSYQRLGDQLRVTVRILNVSDGSLFDSFKLDGTLGQRDNLTQQLVSAVQSKLSGASETDRAATTIDPLATHADLGLAIAVTPFVNISRNPANDDLRSVITETIMSGLRPLTGIQIVRLADADSSTGPSAAADPRNTGWLVNGGYQIVGDQLRITARLVDVSTGNAVESIKIDGLIDQLPILLADAISALRRAVESDTANLSPQMVVGDNTGAP